MVTGMRVWLGLTVLLVLPGCAQLEAQRRLESEQRRQRLCRDLYERDKWTLEMKQCRDIFEDLIADDALRRERETREAREELEAAEAERIRVSLEAERAVRLASCRQQALDLKSKCLLRGLAATSCESLLKGETELCELKEVAPATAPPRPEGLPPSAPPKTSARED